MILTFERIYYAYNIQIEKIPIKVKKKLFLTKTYIINSKIIFHCRDKEFALGISFLVFNHGNKIVFFF